MPEKEIKKIVLGIKNNEYVLPVIQREMVWDYEQIEQLFDSIMSGYPFGSMLFWNYTTNMRRSPAIIRNTIRPAKKN